MDLINYINKEVIIKTKLNEILQGKVLSYSSALQNVEELELEEQASIDVQQSGYVALVYEGDIESISINRGFFLMQIVKE